METNRRIILGIETSCDETAISLIRTLPAGGIEILSEQLASQVELHALYGGVVPELASREHFRALPLLFEKLNSDLANYGLTKSDIDAVSVTQGPGLKGCLLVGLQFALGVGDALGIPVTGVNHVEAHLLSPMISNPELDFPFLGVIVSGGHSEIHLVRGLNDYHLVCRTIDDAAGEAFDKSAFLLGFDYPGGAQLARLADSVEKSRFQLPRAMNDSRKHGFSFSGLKTAASLLIEKKRTELAQDSQLKAEIAYAIQEAIVELLVRKTRLAVKATGVSAVALSGGVSANACLRRELEQVAPGKLYLPYPQHCADNATMIAYLGSRYLNDAPQTLGSADVYARWPIETERGIAI